MKKLIYSLFAFAALCVSCSKEVPVIETADPVLIPKSFSVISPDTKTTLDGVSIKWSANDEICVIAATTGNKYTFAIDNNDVGKTSATFNGSIDAADEAETTFYAVYPNQPIRSVGDGKIVFDKKLNNDIQTQTAVAGGFDPAYSVMVATSDASGTFTFSHRSAFLKITVGNDNVSNINIKTSSTRVYGRPTVPIDDINIAYGSGFYAIDGSNIDNVNLGGTLVKGTSYYLPVPIKNAKVGTITLTYSFNDGTPDKSLSTDTWKNNYFSVGKIYNLGTPVVSTAPEISASDLTIDDDATSGTIDFTISNTISGGTASYSVTTDGLSNASWDTISYNSSTGEGSISFTCDANDDTSAPKTATVHIMYKDGSDNILDETDVTVTQKKKPSGTTTTYTWNFTSGDVGNLGASDGDYIWNSDTAGQTISYSYKGGSDKVAEYPSKSGIYCLAEGGDAKPNASSQKRVYTYSAPCAGTLVLSGYKNSSNDATMTVTLNGTTVSASTGSASAFGSDLTSCEYEIGSAGTVVFYTAKKSYFRSVVFSF